MQLPPRTLHEEIRDLVLDRMTIQILQSGYQGDIHLRDLDELGAELDSEEGADAAYLIEPWPKELALALSLSFPAIYIFMSSVDLPRGYKEYLSDANELQ